MMSQRILQHSVKNALLRMAAPAAFGMLMTFLFQLVDTYFIGRLGSEELAAISFSYPVYFFIVSFFMGTAAGVSSTVGKALGEGNQQRAKSQTTLAIILFMGFTCCLGVAGYFSIQPTFRLLGASQAMAPLIGDYMQILYIGMFALVGTLIANAALMAKGIMVKTMVIMGIGGLVNLVLDYLLIFGIGPIPAMALQGAALATVISWAVMVFLMVGLALKEGLLTSRIFESVSVGYSHIREIIRLSIPAIAAQIVNPIAIAVVTRIVANSGTHAVAAYGIVTRIESLGLTGVLALSVILTPFVAQNYGAKKHSRLDEVIAYSGRMTTYWGLAFLALIFLFSTAIAGIFTDDGTIIEHCSEYFVLVGLSYPAFGLVLITTAFFNGVQQPTASLKLTLFKSLGMTIPLALMGSWVGLRGVWIGLALANLIGAFYANKLLKKWLWDTNSALLTQNPLNDYLGDLKALSNKLMRK